MTYALPEPSPTYNRPRSRPRINKNYHSTCDDAKASPVASYERYPIIVHTSGTCGGEPRIDGTRLTVRVLSEFHRQGESAESLSVAYTIPLWKVKQALDYAGEYREEIRKLILKHERA